MITITVSQPAVFGGPYTLLCEKHGYVAPAGPRLFRGTPHPEIAWTYADKATAEADRITLQEYLDRVTAKISKAKARKEGA